MPKTQRKRTNERKTDYKARLYLLKSDKPRLVVRKTNKYIILQLVESELAQDKVIAKASSADLLTKGWPKEKTGSLKSLPAAYLTGYLLAKNLKVKVKEAILDTGLQRNIAGSRIYAALKGAIDAGLNIPHSEKALPEMERIESNEKLKTIFQKVKGAI